MSSLVANLYDSPMYFMIQLTDDMESRYVTLDRFSELVSIGDIATHPKTTITVTTHSTHIMATRGRILIKLTDGSISLFFPLGSILNGLVSILSNISTPSIIRVDRWW